MKTIEELQAMKDADIIDICAKQVMKEQVRWPIGFGATLRPQIQCDGGWKSWNPLASWDDTMQVVGNANIINMDHIIGYDGKDVGWRALLNIGGKIKQATDKSPQKAICIAAILATQ